ncbi:MAG: GntR family transcriptional regulator [Pseudorhodobacter sp.]
MSDNIPSAYELLRDEILHGDLMPGQRLAVADLRARYGVGLTPLREALMRLTSEGLVEAEANRGAWVSEVSAAELHDLFSTRRDLEAVCLARAMANRSPEWEANILSSLHLLSRAPVAAAASDRKAAMHWESAHRAFHFALVAACDSAWRLRLWHMLADQSARYRKLRLMAPAPVRAAARDIQAEHQAIATAVIAGDEASALALIDSHLARTEDVVAGLLHSLSVERKTPA